MHPTRFLHKMISHQCQTIHKQRLKALFDAASGLVRGKKLSLVGIGRSLFCAAKVKNNIKKIDRLLGNFHLHSERSLIYQSVIKLSVGMKQQPIILVDWSVVRSRRDYWILRASIPVGGRSLILYEEVHPESRLDNQIVNRRFLHKLKELLPVDCNPTIVTDAGFRNPWFKVVRNLGWHFVGRVRNKTHFCWAGKARFQPCKALYVRATLKAAYFGEVILAQKNPMPCHFFLLKQKPKNRIHRSIRGQRIKGSLSRKHAKREKEPWLIATSFSSKDKTAKSIMKIYKSRMQIECSFRDIKNSRNGLSLSKTLTKSAERIEILLLIALLATLIAWLAGVIGYQRNIQYDYQTNTERKQRVLSIFYLGLEILNSNSRNSFKTKQVSTALHWLQTAGPQS